VTSGSPAPDLTQTADTVVVAMAAAGESEAFDEIVRRRHARVRRFMWRVCGNQAEGDDLAQQVFLKAWQAIGRLREPAAFDGWLKRIMVTTWLETARRGRLSIADDQDLERASAAHVPASGLKLDLEGALARLPENQRLCLVLAYDDGMTHDEIAALTGLPLGTVKSNVSRGAARVRAMLADYRERGE
jgi:RNA polymerase sigma-70 factor (ECF subfamily)